MSKGSFNQVLIVENESGDVYIVENQNKRSKIGTKNDSRKCQQMNSQK